MSGPKFENDKFTVYPGTGDAYRDNYDRIFGVKYACEVCGVSFRSMPGLDKGQQLCVTCLKDLVCR